MGFKPRKESIGQKNSRIRIFLDYVRTFLCLFLLLTSKILFDKVPTFWPPCFLVIFWHFLKILRPLFNVYGYDQQKVRLKYTLKIFQNISQKFNFLSDTIIYILF